MWSAPRYITYSSPVVTASGLACVGGPVDSYPALSADHHLLVGSRNGVLTSSG